MIFIYLILAVIVIFFTYSRMRRMLHIMQLEGYRNNQYRNWLGKNKALAFSYKPYSSGDKTPLKMTDRAKRLLKLQIFVSLIPLIALSFILVYYLNINNIYEFVIFLAVALIINYYQPIIILAANLLSVPIENKINRKFFESAQNKLLNCGELVKVGITGSFGKTSTKFIMTSILSHSKNVLTTPSSFNTPMGISKVVNTELTDQHEVFIAEMGARNIGDISELVDLVHPSIGVITNIGPAHLETFKTLENIANTKYELIAGLPESGIAIFNYGNEYLRPLADKTQLKKLYYGLDTSLKLDVYADNIAVSERGSTFTLHIEGKGECICETALLGKHNILNILAGVAVAHVLGASIEEIKDGILNVEPIEHRLQLIDPKTGVLVIDDAFNANPVSVKAALEVLDSFINRRKIIITPGMIELGEKEYDENYLFGVGIAKTCDIAILVGKKRSLPISTALKDNGFDEDKIFIAKDLEEATKIFGKMSCAGDVVLFENDLPDNYRED